MIFTLKNANFNASKIGTLNTWRVVKVLKGVTIKMDRILQHLMFLQDMN